MAAGTTDTKFRRSTGVTTANSTNKYQKYKSVELGDQLDFFLTFSARMATPLDSMEKMKLEPAVREREKVRPWLARVWHKARHCFAKEESPADASSIADILDEYLN